MTSLFFSNSKCGPYMHTFSLHHLHYTLLLLQLYVNSNGKAEQYGIFPVNVSSGFLPFSRSLSSARIAMATKKHLVTLAKHHCSDHSDCNSCKSDKTCGWCIFSNK